MRAIIICVMLLALAGCAGDRQVSVDPDAPLAFTGAVGSPHSYTPHKSFSKVSWWNRGDVTEVFIGGDLEPRESLRHIATENGILYYLGASRDGVGVDRLENYETDLKTQNGADPFNLERDGFKPFTTPPTLYFQPDLLLPENSDAYLALMGSVRMVNDFLPPEFQIEVGGAREGDIVRYGEIMAVFGSSYGVQSVCGLAAAACAHGTTLGNNTVLSILYLPNDLDFSDTTASRTVIVHELVHALGIDGHVDSVEFPDSIMGSHGGYIPNPGHVISKIDREVLQIMYMSQETDLYNDWGEWTDTSFHLVGRTEDEALNFGVALFNGLPQPWARGTYPDADLADNAELTGSATWDGSLLGFSGSSPIAGDAQLQVHLATLSDDDNEQDLRFRDIYFLNRFESNGPERWFYTRNIDYKVNVIGNSFLNVDGEGFVTGALMGPNHEHMGGTVKRTDIVAAFGGSR